jgi:hypothetical protein
MSDNKYWVKFYNYDGEFVSRDFETLEEGLEFCEQALDADSIWDTNIY